MLQLRRAKFGLLFIAFAIAATLAHICVLPGHAHAAPSLIEHPAHDEPATDHHDAPDDAWHAESCDAVRPANAATPPPPTLVAVPVVVTFATVFSTAARPVDTTSSTASPPLYLTHRALRI